MAVVVAAQLLALNGSRSREMPEVFVRYDIGPTGCSTPVPSGTLELSFHQNST